MSEKRLDGEAHPGDENLEWSEADDGWVDRRFIRLPWPLRGSLESDVEHLREIVGRHHDAIFNTEDLSQKALTNAIEAVTDLYLIQHRDHGSRFRRERLAGLEFIRLFLHSLANGDQKIDRSKQASRTESLQRFRACMVSNLEDLGFSLKAPKENRADDSPGDVFTLAAELYQSMHGNERGFSASAFRDDYYAAKSGDHESHLGSTWYADPSDPCWQDLPLMLEDVKRHIPDACARFKCDSKNPA